MNHPSNSSDRAPDSGFVRDTYDKLLQGLPHGYSAYRWAETPVSRFHFRQTTRALKQALKSVPHVERALEVGGGGGTWTPFVLQHTNTLDFLDISAEMLAEARTALSAYPNISYIHHDFLTWEAPHEAYGLAASFRNLEYMQDKRAALKRFASVLTKGGSFLLVTKSPHYDWGGYFNNKALHGGQVPITELLALLQQIGFTPKVVYPAIIGKKTAYAPVRFVWDCVQTALLSLPRFLMPLFFLKYISESFIIVAEKQ